MNTKITLFIIISLILVIPSASAQGINIGEKAVQKSVEVIINDDNEIHVKHIVRSANSPKQMELISGIIENLTITDEKGNEKIITMIGDNDVVMIFPSDYDSIIEYDLKDVLLLKNNIWTLDFLYLETTTFIIPEKLDLIFVNDRPVFLEDNKGISCHGCQMTLEYLINEPKNIMKVNWEDTEYLVEIKSFADIENFEFNQSAKEISFKINNSNQFVTTVIPLELLWGPYAVFLDDEKIFFQDSMNNGTHVWVNIKPDTSGKITMIGTTVVPEFPIIAPLAIGFLMMMMVPFVRKFNLR